MSADRRFTELDVFRGIAALAVVLYHYLFRFDQLYGMDTLPVAWVRPGLYGVHFFFLISGFVIAWSLSTAKNVRAFAISRATRIYPAYWAALLICFTIVALAGLPGREFGVGALVVNFTMVQEYLNVPHIDQAYWTLTTELTFYFWITMICLAGQLERAEFWLLPFMLLGVAHYTELVHVPLRVEKLLLLKHANLFATGIVLHRVYRGADWRTARWFLPLAALCNVPVYGLADALLLAGFMGVFALAVDGRLRWICCTPLLWLGSISYTLYLLHQNIGYVIMRGVRGAGGSEWLAVLAALVMVCVMAEFLSRLVERPAARWLRDAANYRLARSRAR